MRASRWSWKTRCPVFLCILFGLAVSGFAQSGPKRIYIAPDDHTDYLWSADEETHRQVFIEMIDYYLNLADATEKNPPEHQSRWNCDGSFWLWTYEKNKPKAEFERLIRRIRDGHIGVPLNALVSTYGATPAEAVLRGMYYPGQIERRFGLRFPIAIAMEDQTLPFGLGALWAGAGAKYSWKGICGCDTVMQRTKTERRPHEVYWWRGLDGSRILMKWNTFFGTSTAIGGYAEAFDPAAALALVESEPRFTSVYPFRIIGIFGKGHDYLKTLTDEFVTLAAAKTDANRKVIVSNQLDFFEDFEATYGHNLPELSASFGNEWDLYSASMAEVSARVRRAVERLRAAEALATLVSLKRPEFLNGRQPARDQAWMNLGLYWEHDWTSDSNHVERGTRAAWQRKVAGQIESYVNALGADAAYALGGLIEKKGVNLRFYVFNPLSWTRTDVVDLPYGWSLKNDMVYDGKGPVRVIDLSTGLEMPSQLVRLKAHEYVKGRQHLRVQVKDVPPLGYKVFEVQEGAGESFPGGPRVSGGNVIENEAYKITVAPRGAITSLVDKTQGNREFASVVAGRAINDLGPGSGTLEVENAGPLSVTVRATATAPAPHITRITLFRGSRRIEIHNEITRNVGDVQSWGFGFNFRSPDVWHEEVGAVIRAKLLADGGHYSPTNSRLDWLTLNHFAAMNGEGGAGITLSNADLAFMKLGASAMVDGVSQLDVATPLISVLAGGQVDGPKLGIPEQGGDSFFTQRFALETHGAFQATDAMKFALEHQNALVTGIVTGGNAYPEKSYSLLTISDPHVLLWALKPAEEGIEKGIIARVWNLSSSPRNFSLSLETGISSAQRATHIETNIGMETFACGSLSTLAAPSQMLMFLLSPGATGKRPAALKVQPAK
ncbi:MAG: glycoside hydrolase [Acidobacteriota bacterium]